MIIQWKWDRLKGLDLIDRVPDELWMALITASCKMSWPSVHSSSGLCLSDLISWIHSSPPLYNHKGFKSYLKGLVVFPTFFNLSLNFAIRSSWSEPQSAPGLVIAECLRASLSLAANNTISDFGIDHLVMSTCQLLLCWWKGCLL